MSNSRLLRVAAPVIVLAIVVITWEIFARAWPVAPYLLPKPSEILRSFVVSGADLMDGLLWTTLAAVAGFAGSALAGVLIAVALSSSILIRRAFYPYTLFFQTVPIIAIAPMLLFWLGAGLHSVAVCAFIVSVFPVIANTLTGLLSTDTALADLFRLYGAGPVESLWKLRLPSALPSMFTGLRVAAGLSVIGTVIAEFLVGQIVGRAGLGVRIISAIHESRPDLAFAAVILASLLGLGLFGVVNLCGHLALRRWHASEQ